MKLLKGVLICRKRILANEVTIFVPMALGAKDGVFRNNMIFI